MLHNYALLTRVISFFQLKIHFFILYGTVFVH